MASFTIVRRNGDRYDVLVDDDDLARVLAAGPWYILPPRARNRSYYVARAADKTIQLLHRFLLAPAPGVQVDHIDGDGLNNQRSNLRLCTQNQNRGNVTRQRNNTSGFKGVSFHRQTGRWRATLHIQGKTKSLGHYATPEQAHEAYKRAAAQYFGDFARFE